MQEKTMTITGTATKSFAPDLIAVSLEHCKTFETYERALKDASSRAGQIRHDVAIGDLRD